MRSKLVLSIVVLVASVMARADLTPFASEEGAVRFSRAVKQKSAVDFESLATHSKAQTDSILCGPTTATVVLNALRWNTAKAPVIKISEKFLRTMPVSDGKRFDPQLRGYTIQSVLAAGAKVKTEAEIYGQPKKQSDGTTKPDHGLQLEQLAGFFRAIPGIEAQGIPVGTKETAGKSLSEEQAKAITNAWIENLKRAGDYLVVNFQRGAIGQKGGGHISPIAAYDSDSRSFLVLDVNPTKSGWFWIDAQTAIAGMNTYDTVANRGFVVVSEKK